MRGGVISASSAARAFLRRALSAETGTISPSPIENAHRPGVYGVAPSLKRFFFTASSPIGALRAANGISPGTVAVFPPAHTVNDSGFYASM